LNAPTCTNCGFRMFSHPRRWQGRIPPVADNNGNLQNDSVATYTWNGRNKLSGRGVATFQYDSYGRRTRNAAGTNLLYDGSDAAQELSGTTPTANKIVGGTDEFFSRTDFQRFLHADHGRSGKRSGDVGFYWHDNYTVQLRSLWRQLQWWFREHQQLAVHRA
jgi:hypothetical protein